MLEREFFKFCDSHQYEQAMDIFNKILEKLKQYGLCGGDKRHIFFYRLYTVSRRLQEIGNYSNAEVLLLATQDFIARRLGARHHMFGLNLLALAQLYTAQGNYSAAEPLLLKAQQIISRTIGENSSAYASILDSLGEVYRKLGNYSAAEPLLLKAQEVLRDTVGENNLRFAEHLNVMASLHLNAGDHSKAEPLYRQALEIYRKINENDPGYAKTLNNLSVLYFGRGDHSKAEPLLLKAQEVLRDTVGENNLLFVMTLNSLGLAYFLEQDYSAAEPLLLKAQQIISRTIGEDHPEFAANLYSLGLLYLAKADYSAAEPLLLKAQQIISRTIGEDHPEFATSITCLAILYLAKADYSTAELLLLKVQKIMSGPLRKNHPILYSSLEILASIYAVTGRESDALSVIKKTNQIADKNITEIFATATENQRIIFLGIMRGSFHQFLSLILKYFSNSSVETCDALDMILRRKAIATEAFAVQRYAILSSGKYPELKVKLQELDNVRMQIGRSILSGLSLREGDSLVIDQELEELGSKKEILESELAGLVPEIRLEEKLHTSNRYTIANVLTDDEVLIEFVRFYVYDFDPKTVLTETIVKWKPAHYLAFTMHGGEPDNVGMIDVGEADIIDQMIVKFKNCIIKDAKHKNNSSKPTSYYNDSGLALRKALFDPLVPFLKGSKRLLISPDGDLTQLPFEVLPQKHNNSTSHDNVTSISYLIDDYSISYLSSGRDVLRFRGATKCDVKANKSLIAVDPAFDLDIDKGAAITTTITEPSEIKGIQEEKGSRQSKDLVKNGIYFSRLSETKVEGELIADVLDIEPQSLWTDDKVLESTIKASKSPYILHIATHGFFLSDQESDPNLVEGVIDQRGKLMKIDQADIIGFSSWLKLENPLLRSGLALAGANTWAKGGMLPKEAEDGILTAEDVITMDLANTELVVLSACDTALGDVHIGEGVFGLRRSFVLAGAQTLIMSLWKVPDKQTRELMVEFYRGLKKGKGRAEALREAQLYMKTNYANPVYWGAFICQGNSGPCTLD